MRYLLALLLLVSSPVWAQHYRQPSQMSLDGIFTFATLPTASSYNGFTAYTSDQGLVYSNGSTWAGVGGGSIPATIGSNTVIGNATNATAAPAQLAVGSCSTSTSALIWTTNTGFGCNTSINAASLGGATFANPGAIGGGTPAAGTFTQLVGTSGSIAGLTTLGIRDTSAAFDVTIAATSNTALTAGRTLTFNVVNAARTVKLGSDLTIVSDPGAVTGALKSNGAGTFGQAACADLSNGATGCSTATGTSGGTIPLLNAANTWSALQSMTLGETVSGAAISLNDSSNFNTTINTGTSTGTVTVGQNTSTPSSIVLKGPVSFQAGTAFSGASWASTSPVWNTAAVTLNDTTASGTVAKDSGITFQPVTFTSTGAGATTITTASGVEIGTPVCSGGVICTNLYALTVTGKLNVTGQIVGSTGATIAGGTLNFNVNNNNTSNIGTGTTTSAVSIGNGASGQIVHLSTMANDLGTKFTLSNFTGCGTTNGTPTTLLGGSQTGSFVTASSGTTCSVTITPNGATGMTAPNGWFCAGADVTSGVALVQTAKSQTTCALKGTIAATTDVVVWHGFAY